VLSQEEYHALRQLNSSGLEELLCGIRKDRWAQFRESHRVFLWVTGVAGVSIILALVVPSFGIIAYVAWLCIMSLGFSAISRAFALNRECRFLRRSHEIAIQSPTYEAFCEAYLRKIAAFQVLRRDTYHYAVELSGDPILERNAAQNTFVVLGWTAQWNEANELVHYPGLSNDNADSIRICIHSTNAVRTRLIRTSACLKFSARTKETQEKRIAMFSESFQREFKKFGFVLRDADNKAWDVLAPRMELSPYWSRNESGSFSLAYRG
jgi:hypothetical protein